MGVLAHDATQFSRLLGAKTPARVAEHETQSRATATHCRAPAQEFLIRAVVSTGMESLNTRVLIWDWPIRIMHWLLAGGIVAAFAIAKLGDDEGTVFAYHSIIGLMLAAVVLLRLLWGLIGTRHARFRSLLHSPLAVVQYLKGKSRHAGHNPAEAWAVIAMFVLVLLIVASGVLMGMGNEPAEEVHEIAVYALLAVAAIHVGGVIAHSLKHRENLAAAMVSGRKIADETHSIRSAAPLAGIGTVVVIALIGVVLVRGYDSANNSIRLPVLGTTIQLAESENDARAGAKDHDDDDD